MVKVTRVGIVGASGYGAAELIKILLRHPHAKVDAATSREEGSPTVASLHPSLESRIDLRCEKFDADALAEKIDVAFLGLPHGAASTAAKPLLVNGVKVIDLSADYRLRDPATFAKWYGEPHNDVANLGHAVYGLPELFADKIRPARLIANPGCYPTSAILGLTPLLASNLIERGDIIVDSKSGVSGAGRSPKLSTHFPECNESVAAYNVGKHRHTPEISQTLSDIAGESVDVIFTPHLIPMDRGIHSTIYAKLKKPTSEKDLLAAFRDFYRDKPFVRVVDRQPATKDVAFTNFCDLSARVVGDRVIVLSCIDNLIKGAAGAAVQNMNLMFGYEETLGLL